MLLYKDEAFEDKWTTVPSLTLDDDIFVKVFMVKNRRMAFNPGDCATCTTTTTIANTTACRSAFRSIPIFGPRCRTR